MFMNNIKKNEWTASSLGDPVCQKHGTGCLFHGPVCLRG